ncbi:NADH-quinone oxidoreductase subunit A [Sphaerisporangium rubeum]|uniref:NADH-quinone oxidoreductase subunit n=1 Tax=Sphaerisporangium rubeum TaxID=321317 RepID=A0A7X0IBM3_9ACTN|nr:NADH-quinone oxidoreductase subunit A [Sphaerisporangium rubeum]MBB6471504.1 NADH-quinone oxidoreductase subunit A [Sphaerisporangium rubeum]
MSGYYGSYLIVAVLLLVGCAVFAGAMLASRMLSPRNASPEKLTTYECGVDPVGEGWAQSQIRYYVFTYLYVVFAVDAVFLFPWATVFAAPGFGLTTLVEMFVFLAFIALGILYAYRKRVLTWT